MAVLTTVVLAVFALTPFKWNPPRLIRNGAVILPGNGVKFPRPGIVIDREASVWLADAIEHQSLCVKLRLRSYKSSQSRSARVFTVSRDQSSRNLTIGQDGKDLVVRLRRNDLYNGTPEFRVPSVFESDAWHDLEVVVETNRLTVRLDGALAVEKSFESSPLESWNSRFAVAFGNEFTGDRPWLGEISRAIISGPIGEIDYLSSRTLDVPDYYYEGMQRDFFMPLSDSSHRQDLVSDITLNCLGFIPLGFLFAQSNVRRPVLFAVAASFVISLTFELAQLSIGGRIASIVDLSANVFGSALGAFGARFWPLLPRRCPT